MLTELGACTAYRIEQHPSDRLHRSHRHTSHLLNPTAQLPHSKDKDHFFGSSTLSISHICGASVEGAKETGREISDLVLGAYRTCGCPTWGHGHLECCIWDQPPGGYMA